MASVDLLEPFSTDLEPSFVPRAANLWPLPSPGMELSTAVPAAVPAAVPLLSDPQGHPLATQAILLVVASELRSFRASGSDRCIDNQVAASVHTKETFQQTKAHVSMCFTVFRYTFGLALNLLDEIWKEVERSEISRRCNKKELNSIFLMVV